jgi:archaeal flagellar protein FlaF
MSAGPLVASGIGIILLIITAYVLVGGTLSTTEVMVLAQGDLAIQQETRMRTGIAIDQTLLDMGTSTLYVEVKNTGSEPIVRFEYVDVFITDGSAPVYIPHGSGPGTWSVVAITPDLIHPSQLDPGETLNLSVRYTGDDPVWVQVTTGNGVYDSAYI